VLPHDPLLGYEPWRRRPGWFVLLGALLATVGAGAGLTAAEAPAPAKTAADLSDAEKERFLLEGQIVKRKSAKGGITLSERATLRLGDLEHDCHIQRIDEHKPSLAVGSTTELDFHDSFRNNVAAYRIDRLLGLGMAAVTVMRRDGDRAASFMWWVDDVMLNEKERYERKIQAPDPEAWNHQIFAVRVFDQLIFNFDRNLGNLVIDKDWRVWMIDHSRAFKAFKELRTPKNLGTHCDRSLLAALRRLDQPALKAAMKDLLTPAQINGLLGRRDLIVQYYDAKAKELGEDAVLYDLPRVRETPAPH